MRPLVRLPWNEHYQWQDETEESWSERAQQTFGELRESLGQQGTSAQQKIQQAAGMIGVKVGNDQVADVAGVEPSRLKLPVSRLGFQRQARGKAARQHPWPHKPGAQP